MDEFKKTAVLEDKTEGVIIEWVCDVDEVPSRLIEEATERLMLGHSISVNYRDPIFDKE